MSAPMTEQEGWLLSTVERPGIMSLEAWRDHAVALAGRLRARLALPVTDGVWEALRSCIEGFRLTREYVGEGLLPKIPGWSWYDAALKAHEALGVPLPEWMKADTRESRAALATRVAAPAAMPGEVREAMQRIDKAYLPGHDAVTLASYIRSLPTAGVGEAAPIPESQNGGEG